MNVIQEISTTLPATVSVVVTESRPAVKARNGRWVEPTHVHLTFALRLTLPGNVVVEPTNLNHSVKFTRRVDEPKAWHVANDRAWGFQAYARTFGNDAVAAARAALGEYGVLDLFRIAATHHAIG